MKAKELKEFFKTINQSADKVIEILLACYFLFGIFLAYFYDTWVIATMSGMLVIALYFITKITFSGKTTHHYVASLGLGIFMAQFIYQMHGLFEMHFTAFLAVAIMVFYRNWKLFLPITGFVVIHHAAFAYIQYLGLRDNIEAYQQIYFTQMEYMDLQTFLFHAGLFAVFTGIMAYHSHQLRQETITTANNIIDLEKEKAKTNENIHFANEIAQGNYSNDYDLMEGDLLGEALLNMRMNLQESSQREKEDRFKNVGLAQIGEIIRNNGDNLNTLSDDLIKYLVKYLDANQGAVFIKEGSDNDIKLRLRGCYAYDRKKYIDMELNVGEGLAGQCYLEKEYIYLTDIPKDYINITSGLGKATPNTVVIIPLIYNETVEGVMEIASFGTIEKHQIDFLVKIGESIASAIANVRTSEVTTKLYQESQEQAEQLRSQEEEMRQNMEELSATQEEMQRNAMEMEETFKALDESEILYMEMDMDGALKNVNKKLSKLLGIDTNVDNWKYSDFVDHRIENSESYYQFWNELKTGNMQKGTYTLKSVTNKKIAVTGSFTLVKNGSGEPMKTILAGSAYSETHHITNNVLSSELNLEDL